MKDRLVWLRFCACLGFCLTSVALAQERRYGDSEIEKFIESRIERERISTSKIEAKVKSGKVTLTGVVASALQKERAEQIAAAVRGVRAVDNEIRTPAPSEDASLRKKILDEIREARLPHENVAVDVDAGKVRISGRVNDADELGRLLRAVDPVVGGRETTYDVDLDKAPQDRRQARIGPLRPAEPPSVRPDAERSIRRLLQSNARIYPGMVDVSVVGSRAVLRGEVESFAQVLLARRLALTAGVAQVDTSALVVNPRIAQARDRSRVATRRIDGEIRQDVEMGIASDPGLSAVKPRVSVARGVVTLSGKVASLQNRREAENIAGDVLGVVRIENRLEVVDEGPAIPDADVARRVEMALVASPFLEADEIESVTARAGVVTLAGKVDSYYESRLAEDIASDQRGVRELRNGLVVDQERFSKEGDEAMVRTIREELAWSPEVDADQVKVDVRQGVVTLSGTVDTLHERRVAEENAWDGGARKVVNELEVISERR